MLRLPVAATALIFFKMGPGYFYHDSGSEIYVGQASQLNSVVPHSGNAVSQMG